jgi:hypothetical protein
MTEIYTKSEFARRLGVRASAVSNYVARGQISGAALLSDGRINGPVAEDQLKLTVDLIRSRGGQSRRRQFPQEARTAPRAGVQSGHAVLSPGKNQPAPGRPRSNNGQAAHKPTPTGGRPPVGRPPVEPIDFGASADLLRARATIAQVEAEERRQRYLASRGTFMLAADVEAAWTRELEEIIAVVEAGLVDLADALGSRERCLPVIRRWWRALRLNEAARQREKAKAEPEFLADREAL